MRRLALGLVALAAMPGGCGQSPGPAPTAGSATIAGMATHAAPPAAAAAPGHAGGGASGSAAAASPRADAPAPGSPVPAPPGAGPVPANVLTQVPEIPRPPVASYDVRGRRDPFDVLETREGAPGTTVSAAKLAGIIQGAEGPLALIETPDGLGYILRPGDTLAEGRVVEILPDRVVFSMPAKRGVQSNRVVLRLPGDS
jgi:hypothetical protein